MNWPGSSASAGNGAQCPAEIICSGIAGSTIRRGGSFVRSSDAASVMSPLIPAAYLNDNGMEEILQLRRMIEGPVCGEACRRASEEDVKELEYFFKKMEATKDYLPEFARFDYLFHIKMARIAGNSIIMRIYDIMNEVMKCSFEKVVQARGNRAGLYYHGRIVDAFERKDDEAAEKKYG